MGCDDYIQCVSRELPRLCKPKHLIQIGLFNSNQHEYKARKLGKCPEYFKMDGRVLYPKEGIIRYLYKRKAQ